MGRTDVRESDRPCAPVRAHMGAGARSCVTTPAGRRSNICSGSQGATRHTRPRWELRLNLKINKKKKKNTSPFIIPYF